MRTYTWNGHTFPISMPHLTDAMMAGRVRMLMRDEWMHEAVCVAARDRIMCLSAEIEALATALKNIRELNLMQPDEDGHRWANSDLIEQEIAAALAACN